MPRKVKDPLPDVIAEVATMAREYRKPPEDAHQASLDAEFMAEAHEGAARTGFSDLSVASALIAAEVERRKGGGRAD